MVKLTVLFLTLLGLLASTVQGQNWQEKCSPSVRLLERSNEIQSYQLVVRNQAAFLAHLKNLNGIRITGTYEPAGIIVVETTPSTLFQLLLPMSDLLYADRGNAKVREELTVPGHNLFVNNIPVLRTLYPDWNGEGRTISIKENRFDSLDLDLWGRVVPFVNASSQLSPHAILMATLAGGAGNSGPGGWGAAWAARLSSSNFATLLPDADQVYASQSISVQNHSYGVGIENYYGADAMAYDQSVAIRPYLLQVFSAGNLGDTSALLGTYSGLKGYANLSGSFKMAKNVLLVGAIDSFKQVTPFSSRGPAYDGRIKPDLVAYGQDGSSGAAALVSGVAAVLQQVYADKNQGALPSAALVRAVLINGAEDIGAAGPDFGSGFGNLDARRSVEIIKLGTVLEASIGQSDTFFLEIAVPSNSRLLKITLAWDDPPAFAGAATALVHDLDMTVLGPGSSAVFHPLVLNTAPVPDSLSLPAAQGIDSLNTVEQIIVFDPTPGNYRVEVRAKKIGSSPQTFALAYQCQPADTFQWIGPTRVDPLIAGRMAILYWQHSFSATNGRLEYQLVGQSGWQLLDAQASILKNTYTWVVPDTTALVQLRMTIDGHEFYSDSFLIAPELYLKVGFFCPDSTLLYWNKPAGTPAFQIWGLGTRYLEPLLVTADTFAVLPRVQFPQKRMAVSPLVAPGVLGLRTGAIDISQQGLDCYFRNLLAELDYQQHVQLKFEIGSTYGLQALVLEKWVPGVGYVPIESWNPPFFNQIQFEATDYEPAPGPNIYRINLLFSQGANWFSDPVTLYFGGPNGYWLYPNPIAGQGQLQVVSQEPADALSFVLYDPLGRMVLERSIEATLELITLPPLAPGLYPYTFLENGRRMYSGKLLVGK